MKKIPQLHVIAAGSLLDFAIEQIGLPVGRVSSLYMYPMSFLEFLVAQDKKEWVNIILQPTSENSITNQALHNSLLDLIGIYIAIGGMPAAIQSPYGIRMWAGSYATDVVVAANPKDNKKIQSYPLYAVVKPLLDSNVFIQEALQFLIQ